MRKYLAEEIAEKLAAFGTKESIVAALMEAYIDEDFISWSVDDVLDEAERHGDKYELSRGEARDILRSAINSADAQYGVTWDSIYTEIEWFVANRAG